MRGGDDVRSSVSEEGEVMSSEFERLRESCLKKGELFEVPDFPAVQTSIFYHQKPPFSFVWKRPKVAFALILWVFFLLHI